LITTKKKEEIVRKLFEMWVSYFGRPKKLMSDNGGEFANDVYDEVAEKLGIEIVRPPAESPFSNGIVERHNKVL
jgi:IS30 family transposase